MPIYEYRCLKCGHQFEKMQKIADRPVSKCEKCKERVTRVFHPVAIHFKGSGFYSTDYGRKHKDSRKKSGGGDIGGESKAAGDSRGGKSKAAGESGSSKKKSSDSSRKAASGSKES